jgi:hypothetical protein
LGLNPRLKSEEQAAAELKAETLPSVSRACRMSLNAQVMLSEAQAGEIITIRMERFVIYLTKIVVTRVLTFLL